MGGRGADVERADGGQTEDGTAQKTEPRTRGSAERRADPSRDSCGNQGNAPRRGRPPRPSARTYPLQTLFRFFFSRPDLSLCKTPSGFGFPHDCLQARWGGMSEAIIQTDKMQPPPVLSVVNPASGQQQVSIASPAAPLAYLDYISKRRRRCACVVGAPTGIGALEQAANLFDLYTHRLIMPLHCTARMDR